ncbi:hypothetical protein A9P82_03415 [Arachidicoccus ginsenosidimutans]|uniref:hypothetical protein n=1 Tax=Arachidicoccus sp. BS20 TaxID=1850526 RepID=UPI0007F0E57F|nr:hypothetical protein [Arachidicoccus sp. BS20]ANI88434.1 hypothetical protein A9P82_03415 [Arachidicoccus sp. BS20]
MKTKTVSRLLAGVFILGLSACSKSNSSTTSDNTDKSSTIQLSSNATFGNIITDGNGMTLYFFSIDATGQSGCSGDCTVAWPTYYAATPTIGDGLNSSDFGTITRPDGSKQTTYKGWPLYYYMGDTKAGDVTGDAVNNVWFVAKPDYTVMLANEQLVGNDGKNYTGDYQEGTGVTQYITDAVGNTLYSFTPDKFNTNTFTKSDFSNNAVWPIDTISTIQSVPSILKKSDFAVIQVFGKPQLTYKGWPLYYFGADGMMRGNTKGVSVPTPGVWPIVNTKTNTAPQPVTF